VVSASGGLPSGSRQPLARLADSAAAQRLAVAVYAPDELSRGKSSSKWRSTSSCTVVSNAQPSRHWRAMVCAEWLELWWAPTKNVTTVTA
jgi:hypothetical protein